MPLLIQNDNDVRADQFFYGRDRAYKSDALLVLTVADGLITGKVEDATNTSPIVVTSAGVGSKPLANGHNVVVVNVNGNRAANTTAVVANLDAEADTFELSGIAGDGAFIDAQIPASRGDWYKVVPGCEEITLDYLPGTQGNYLGVIPAEIPLEKNRLYVLVIRALNYPYEAILREVARERMK